MPLNDILNYVAIGAVVIAVLVFGIYLLMGKGESMIPSYSTKVKNVPQKYHAKNLSRLIGLVLILIDVIAAATALTSMLTDIPWITSVGGGVIVAIAVVTLIYANTSSRIRIK